MFDDRTDEALFKGTEDKCYEWINTHYPEESKDYNHIWIGIVYQKPSEEDLNLIQEMIEAHGLAYAIETGTLTDNDVESERLSELIYEAHDAIRNIKRLIEQ